uniref:Uncharacterized protein MANES_16G104800 n=1 Tax=Rhizophora mucronata TaxID=61149 RepID=A0A2P2LX72_RHIMU
MTHSGEGQLECLKGLLQSAGELADNLQLTSTNCSHPILASNFLMFRSVMGSRSAGESIDHVFSFFLSA